MFWFEDEVRYLENKKFTSTISAKRVVFYGSSSIRLWNSLLEQFPDKNVLNLGFGGSTLAACTWYFERVVLPFRPNSLVIYAGDNDLGDGRHPEEVFLFLLALMQKIKYHLGDIDVSFISIKPSIARWNIINQIRYTNQMIQHEITRYPSWHYIDIFHSMMDNNGYPKRELFLEDGLHLSRQGYHVWEQLIRDNHDYIF